MSSPNQVQYEDKLAKLSHENRNLKEMLTNNTTSLNYEKEISRLYTMIT